MVRIAASLGFLLALPAEARAECSDLAPAQEGRLGKVFREATHFKGGRYVVPGPERLARFEKLFGDVAMLVRDAKRAANAAQGHTGATLRALAAAACARGLELFRLREGSDVHLVLREQADRREGRGIYALRLTGERRRLVVASPHAIFDAGTQAMAVQVYRRTRALALLSNTVHRYLLGRPKSEEPSTEPGHEGDTGVPSDAAHCAHGFFHVASRVLSERAPARTLIWQLHGFSHQGKVGKRIPRDVQMVLSDGTRGATAEAHDAWYNAAAGAFAAAYGDAARRYRVDGVKALGATTNVLFRWIDANRKGEVDFLHIEHSRPLRRSLGEKEAMEKYLAVAEKIAAARPLLDE